jgi:hypothetical protein
MTKIYGIIDKETNSFVEFNGRSCWKSTGGAKLSYAEATVYFDGSRWIKKKFDDQARYEIVELTEVYFRLEGLEK